MFNSFWNKYGEKIISISKGAIIAALGTIATYVLREVGNTDFGEWTPVIVGINSVIVNILRKFGVPVIVSATKFISKSFV